MYAKKSAKSKHGITDNMNDIRGLNAEISYEKKNIQAG